MAHGAAHALNFMDVTTLRRMEAGRPEPGAAQADQGGVYHLAGDFATEATVVDVGQVRARFRRLRQRPRLQDEGDRRDPALRDSAGTVSDRVERSGPRVRQGFSRGVRSPAAARYSCAFLRKFLAWFHVLGDHHAAPLLTRGIVSMIGMPPTRISSTTGSWRRDVTTEALIFRARVLGSIGCTPVVSGV